MVEKPKVAGINYSSSNPHACTLCSHGWVSHGKVSSSCSRHSFYLIAAAAAGGGGTSRSFHEAYNKASHSHRVKVNLPIDLEVAKTPNTR